MRIGAKLLVTYVTIIVLLVGLIGVGLPRFVEGAVAGAEQERLDAQVHALANSIAERMARAVSGSRPGLELYAAKQVLQSMQDLLVADTALIVDPQCVVVRASRKELEGHTIKPCATTGPDRQREELGLEGVQTRIIARAQIPGPTQTMSGYTVFMFRDVPYIQKLTRPITRRIALAMSVVVVIAMLIALWLSREMVKRLQATSQAAQALAGGDLSQRAPEAGSDEITDLARHFNHMAERIQVLVNGLRRSEQARKELLITCSHELRTPMTSISGFAEALRDGMVADEGKRQRYYAIIASESTRLTRLVNDLFDMAKLEAGQMELRLQAMTVGPWLTEFAEAHRPAVEAEGLRLELVAEPEAEHALIYGDRDRLDQVLTNLLSNASRFSPPGAPITIRAEVDAGQVTITVRDLGPGVSADEQAHVFERFFRGSWVKHAHQGAGLGLAIVKSMVEAHGGTVGVESVPGSGAAFWFRLGRQ